MILLPEATSCQNWHSGTGVCYRRLKDKMVHSPAFARKHFPTILASIVLSTVIFLILRVIKHFYSMVTTVLTGQWAVTFMSMLTPMPQLWQFLVYILICFFIFTVANWHDNMPFFQFWTARHSGLVTIMGCRPQNRYIHPLITQHITSLLHHLHVCIIDSPH